MIFMGLFMAVAGLTRFALLARSVWAVNWDTSLLAALGWGLLFDLGSALIWALPLTLLLTFLYRHLPELIRQQRVFIALPPLYRIDIGKETYWAADDADRDRLLKEKQKGNAKADITRFKGLGEMMAKTLWDTTLNPKTRRMLRVNIADALETDRIFGELMGKDASARFHFIMDRADEAADLDV